MKTYQIPVSLLAAVSPFISKFDIRLSLQHVCIETFEHGFNVVATNGHILGVAQIKTGESLGRANDLFFIHRDVVLNVLKNSKVGYFVEVWKDKNNCFSKVNDSTFGNPVIVDLYPFWRAVTPVENTGVSASFDADLIRKICDCAKMYKKYESKIMGKSFGIQLEQNFNTPSCWAISGLRDGVSIAGVVMPLKDVKATAFDTISKISG